MTKGYEVTFEDFVRLTSDTDYLPDVAPLLKQWFGYDIELIGPPGQKSYKQQTVIRDRDGREVDRRELHNSIQADDERQGSLYRTAQTLWR